MENIIKIIENTPLKDFIPQIVPLADGEKDNGDH